MAKTATKEKTESKPKQTKKSIMPAQTAQGRIEKIDLKDIVSNSAQSRGFGVLPKMKGLGYGLFEKIATDKECIWEMLLGDSQANKDHCLDLLTEHESKLCALADSLRLKGQLQPAVVVQVKDSSGNDDGYDVIAGMRRVLASAYNYAKHGTPCEVEVKVLEGEHDEAALMILSLTENDDREGESLLDRAFFCEKLKKVTKANPKIIGDAIGVSDQSVTKYLKLLDPLLEKEWPAIHSGRLTLEKAMLLLDARKKSGDPNAKVPRKAQDGRNRLPSVKKMVAIYTSSTLPKGMSDEEWRLWCDPKVREFLAYKLGLEYTPEPTKIIPSEPKAAPNTEDSSNGDGEHPILKDPSTVEMTVKRERAIALLDALGVPQAEGMSNEVLAQKLENIPNLVEDGQEVTGKLKNLLNKLMDGYKEGMKIIIKSVA